MTRSADRLVRAALASFLPTRCLRCGRPVSWFAQGHACPIPVPVRQPQQGGDRHA